MKISTLLLSSSVPLLALGIAGSASAYQFEIGADYSQGDVEDVDFDTVGVTGTYYFGDVPTGNGPLAEAAFLGRASGFSLGYSASDIDDVDINIDTLEGSLRLVSMDTGWLATLGFARVELDDSVNTAHVDQLSIGFGRYFGENNTITLHYSDLETKVDGFSGSADGNSVSLQFKGVAVGRTTYVLEAGITYSEIEDEDATGFSVGWTVYPSMNIGAGVSYAQDMISTSVFEGIAASADIDSKVLVFNGSWFVTESIEIGLRYADIEVGDVDAVEIGLTGRIRF